MSPKDKTFKIRLSEDEFAKLEAAAKAAEFKNISEYVRYMTFGEGRSLQDDLKDIKSILEKISEK